MAQTRHSNFAPTRAETLANFGIEHSEPTYLLHDDHVRADPARAALLQEQLDGLYVEAPFALQVFANLASDARPATVLLRSDSFGDLAAQVFAGGFRELIQINTNHLAAGRGPELLARVRRFAALERVILLVQEGNLPRLGECLP